MKTIETKGGMIFEIWETRKEAMEDIETMDFDMEWWSEDDSLYIQYKDGSHFSVDTTFGVEGKLKKTNIDSIVYSNACTTMVFGNFVIYNIDDNDEEYSEAADDEFKFWNAINR